MKKILVLLAVMCGLLTAQAQNDVSTTKPLTEKAQVETPWSISFQVGGALAFGDDSWHVIDDFKNANGTALSLSLGRHFTSVFGARIKARYLKLYNRINLEVYDAYKDKYPDFFPRDGFYGYHGFALEAEALFNLTNLIKRDKDWFNLYVLAGVGYNRMGSYDKNVSNWDGSYEGLMYQVDTKAHDMPVGVLGGMLDFRVAPELSINLELLGSFTGDNMEGVRYEESYDVYITYSIGATIHF